MRALFKLLLWLLFLSPFAVLALAWLALSEQPLVVDARQLSHKDIQRAQEIIHRNDPRRLAPGSQRRIDLSGQDIALAATYGLQHLGQGGAQAQVEPGRADLTATLRLARLPLRPYLNLHVRIIDDDTGTRLNALRLGTLDIPPRLAEFMFDQAIHYLIPDHQLALARAAVQRIAIVHNQVQLTYEWNPALMREARDTLLSADDQAIMQIYHNKLLWLDRSRSLKRAPLLDVLQPLFQLAQSRSQEHDPIRENRALLTLLGGWAGGSDLAEMIPGSLEQPGRFQLRLQRRMDFAQHFLISAALAARSDGALADAIGLFKELSDSNGGSGFSFTDIAADRSGTRFGEVATGAEMPARELQNLLAQGIAETDLMPAARDLPEHMNSAEFEARFGGVGSPRYTEMMAEIERRIAALDLYRE